MVAPPTGNLDSRTGAEILDLLRLRDGKFTDDLDLAGGTLNRISALGS